MYKTYHLHNFPCTTTHSHYQSRDMSIIPTLFTFPSKPYEPRDMKENFGKLPHWDTSESSCDYEWCTMCIRLKVLSYQSRSWHVFFLLFIATMSFFSFLIQNLNNKEARLMIDTYIMQIYENPRRTIHEMSYQHHLRMYSK